jgi:hypothetical protein
VTAELSALERPATSFVTTGERILELVKRAGILYKTQDPAEQRRLLESVLSNCTFDRGSVCPTYKKPFDLFVRGNENGEWWGPQRADSARWGAMAGSTGLEPAASAVTGQRSSQLNYDPKICERAIGRFVTPIDLGGTGFEPVTAGV